MRSLLKVTTISVIFVAILGFANTACAREEMTVSDNEHFLCTVPEADDLHITYYSDTSMTLLSHFDDNYNANGPFPIFGALPNADRSVWECTWSGKTVTQGEWVHVGVVFQQEAKNWLAKKDIYWTLNGERVPDGDMQGPGIIVDPPSGEGPINYRIINSTGSDFIIRNLQLRISPEPLDLPSMMYGVIDPNGQNRDELGIPSEITLVAGEEYPIEISEPWEVPPFYVQVQGLVEVNGEIVSNFVQQHEHIQKIPTVSEWGLIIMALLLLTAGAIMIVRRRQRVAA